MIIVWALEQDHFDDADIKWCKGLAVKYIVTPLVSTVYMQGQAATTQQLGLRIRLYTTTESQESMLKLKYGHRLIYVQNMTEVPPSELHELDF